MARGRAQTWWEQQGYATDHPLFGTMEVVVARPEPDFDLESNFEADDQGRPLAIPFRKAPTNTSNRYRPRTIAAGYDRESETLRVQFRSPHRQSRSSQPWVDDGEGAVYDYYEVTPNEWRDIKRVVSTGKFINRRLAGKDYTRIER